MVIVGNTIRLDIQNRRDEIEVTKLVGGSDAFVRRPFLYNGVWYGLGGAVIAWVITAASPSPSCASPSAGWPASTAAAFELGALGPKASAVLLLSGVVLGWLGSYIAATPAPARDRADLIGPCRVNLGYRSTGYATGSRQPAAPRGRNLSAPLALQSLDC